MSNKNPKTSTLNEVIIKTVKTKHPKTVTQLVELVCHEQPSSKQEIIASILRLQNQGKLNFKKDTTFISATLLSEFFHSNSFWYWFTITLSLATVTTVLTIPENAYPFV